MSRRQRLLPTILLLTSVIAVTSWSADRTDKAAGNSPVVKESQTSGAVAPAPAVTPTVVGPAAPGITANATSPLYQLDWYSINSGGAIDAASASYKMGLSVAQTSAGEAASATYRMGMGFWYGLSDCNCPRQGDIDNNGSLDVFDVIGIVDITFSGAFDPRDSGCPATRGDVNFDGSCDVFDVIYLIDTCFSGGTPPVNPCG